MDPFNIIKKCFNFVSAILKLHILANRWFVKKKKKSYSSGHYYWCHYKALSWHYCKICASFLQKIVACQTLKGFVPRQKWLIWHENSRSITKKLLIQTVISLLSWGKFNVWPGLYDLQSHNALLSFPTFPSERERRGAFGSLRAHGAQAVWEACRLPCLSFHTALKGTGLLGKGLPSQGNLHSLFLCNLRAENFKGLPSYLYIL